MTLDRSRKDQSEQGEVSIFDARVSHHAQTEERKEVQEQLVSRRGNEGGKKDRSQNGGIHAERKWISEKEQKQGSEGGRRGCL